MTAQRVTARGRIIAEALMVDTGTITRPASPTFDPGTGLITPAATTSVYAGPLRVRQPTATESEIMFGEEQLTQSRFIVDTPHDTTGVQVDDIVTVTDSDDGDVLTRRYRVTAIPMGTFVVSKSFPAEVVE